MGGQGPLPRQPLVAGDARGPGAAGCRRPAPARSSGRPARAGAAAGWSSRGSAWRSGRCAPGRTGGHRPARADPGRGSPGPAHHSHSTFGGRVRAGTRWTCTRTMVPRTIGRGLRVPWPGWRCCLGCSPAQACTVTVPYWSSLAKAGGRGRPGGRVGAGELGAVAARPAALGGTRRWWRVGVEAAVGAQPHQHRGGLLGQVEGELGGVVAGVEHEQRHGLAGGQPARQRRICAAAVWSVSSIGCRRRGVDRGGPGVPVEAELGDPLEGPAGDDRLAGRMARGMVVVAALGRALGVAARPGGHIDGVDRRVGGRQAAASRSRSRSTSMRPRARAA